MPGDGGDRCACKRESHRSQRLIGYLYGITSERKLVEELRMPLAWRWFTGLAFDPEIPHHSTFSKNRHGRLIAGRTVPG
jgi:transposase